MENGLRDSLDAPKESLFFSRDKIDIKYKLVHEYSFGAVSKCPFFCLTCRFCGTGWFKILLHCKNFRELVVSFLFFLSFTFFGKYDTYYYIQQFQNNHFEFAQPVRYVFIQQICKIIYYQDIGISKGLKLEVRKSNYFDINPKGSALFQERTVKDC